MTGTTTIVNYPRRVKFRDARTSRTFHFQTSRFSIPAGVVADLYRSRGQVTQFCQWIQQHLRIKSFLCTTENAVKTQVWIGVRVYGLDPIAKKRLWLPNGMHTMLQVPSLTLFEREPLGQTLLGLSLQSAPPDSADQFRLFGP